MTHQQHPANSIRRKVFRAACIITAVILAAYFISAGLLLIAAVLWVLYG